MVWNCFLNNQPVPIPKKVGRKTKKTATTVSIVKQYVFADPLISCKEISSLLKINYNLELSPTIIGEILRANKFHYGELPKCPELTDNQKSARVEFAKRVLANWDENIEIVFSDESRFANTPDHQYGWQGPGPKHYRAAAKYHLSQMVWGAIGKDYKSKLFFCTNHMDAEEYKSILVDGGFLDDANQHFKDPTNWAFQQDGATIHTCEFSTKWITSKAQLIKDWPANSPDLNVIEIIWAVMKDNIFSAQHPQRYSTLAELKEAVQRAWDSISMETINALIRSFPRRLMMVIEHNGECIKEFWKHGQPPLEREVFAEFRESRDDYPSFIEPQLTFDERIEFESEMNLLYQDIIWDDDLDKMLKDLYFKFHGDLKKVAQQFHTRRIDLLKERMRGRPKNRVRINRRPAEYKVPEGDDDDEDYEVLSDEEDSPDDEVHITKDDFCKTDKEFEEYSAYVSASTSVPPSSDREASSDDWSTSDYDYD